MAKSKKKREQTERRLWLVSMMLLAFELGYQFGAGPPEKSA